MRDLMNRDVMYFYRVLADDEPLLVVRALWAYVLFSSALTIFNLVGIIALWTLIAVST